MAWKSYASVIVGRHLLRFACLTWLALACSGKKPSAPRLDDFDRLYLSMRPPVGAVSVVDVTGETFGRKVLAASLQGVVNRTQARLYLLDGAPESSPTSEEFRTREAAAFWLEHYSEKYGVSVISQGVLDDALAQFASEASGYVVASPTEPWTVDAATTIAASEGALVTFDADQGQLQGLGVPLLADLRGKWGSAPACYADMFATYYAGMRHPGFAGLSPTEYRLRDFLIEQGVFTVYALPGSPEWTTLKGLLDQMPSNVAVYGYMASSPQQELTMVQTLSAAGKFLIATDLVANLSFHVAVVPEPTASAPQLPQPRAPGDPQACDPKGANVVVAISDGDNLAMPVVHYPWTNYWRSSTRGQIPVGWSQSPALRAIAPAIDVYYQNTATPNDEAVAMLGIGYADPSVYRDLSFFFSESAQSMSSQGMEALWLIAPALYSPSDSTWGAVDRSHFPAVLLGYGGIGTPSFRTVAGTPVLMVTNGYAETAAQIASEVQTFLNTPVGQRPPVLFLNATVWTASYEDLVSALSPLQAQGVRFLRPVDAFPCLP
jgi:putative glycoside hydrolase with GxGYxYP motif/GxGYxY motif-containing protein